MEDNWFTRGLILGGAVGTAYLYGRASTKPTPKPEAAVLQPTNEEMDAIRQELRDYAPGQYSKQGE